MILFLQKAWISNFDKNYGQSISKKYLSDLKVARKVEKLHFDDDVWKKIIEAILGNILCKHLGGLWYLTPLSTILQVYRGGHKHFGCFTLIVICLNILCRKEKNTKLDYHLFLWQIFNALILMVLSSFMSYHLVCYRSIMMNAISGAGQPWFLVRFMVLNKSSHPPSFIQRKAQKYPKLPKSAPL
jgi:hypothetical protein